MARTAGVDVDKLVTVLSWELNPDGSLASRPVLVSQTGVNDSIVLKRAYMSKMPFVR
jgi:hypothetical protein